jgi:hypothetical protein
MSHVLPCWTISTHLLSSLDYDTDSLTDGALYGGNGFGLGASYPLADPISGYGSYGGFMTNGAYVMSNSIGGPAMSRPMAPSGPAPVSSVNLAPLGKTV